jgi:ATP/maltotriose-dependent transcriptional regulator MalT
LYRQGKLDEAEGYTIESEKVAASDDVSSQFLWRAVRARILARRGALEDGEALARTALDIIRTSDEPDSQAEGLLALAEVLALAGRVAEAAAAARGALELRSQGQRDIGGALQTRAGGPWTAAPALSCPISRLMRTCDTSAAY